MEEKKDNLEKKKIILSGIQPTGKFHIGNLIGAIKNWVLLQEQYDCFFSIVDLHSLSIRQEPSQLRKNTLELAAMLLASGIDPDKSVLFVQSHVPAHTQLAWILNCNAQMGELHRMTQFKDKAAKNPDNVNVGLFTYPVLQAADILLYNADLVPVGEDQKQHLELTRDIAIRFNHYYPNTFKIPEPYIPPLGARIMNLQEPTKKMSKSDDNEKATIYLTDGDAEIKNKIKRAVTDAGTDILYRDDKPGIKNLMTLYSIASGLAYDEIENQFAGKGYAEFKSVVAEAVANYVSPIRAKYEEIRADKKKLEEIIFKGAEKAKIVANRTLYKVYRKVGLYGF